jgi:hypothetical protein
MLIAKQDIRASKTDSLRIDLNQEPLATRCGSIAETLWCFVRLGQLDY